MAELLTGTFYLLMIALGFFAGALVKLNGAGLAAQCVWAAFVALAAIVLLRRSRFGRRQRRDASANPDVLLDVGARVEVSRRDQLEPIPDPCPHAVCAAHAMVVGLDPHAECCMLHALTGCCCAPAACHRWTGEARIDMLEPSEHAQTRRL